MSGDDHIIDMCEKRVTYNDGMMELKRGNLSESHSPEEGTQHSRTFRTSHVLVIVRYLHGSVLRPADNLIDFFAFPAGARAPLVAVRTLTNKVRMRPVEPGQH